MKRVLLVIWVKSESFPNHEICKWNISVNQFLATEEPIIIGINESVYFGSVQSVLPMNS